jgi:hypothetical protein
MLSERIQRQIDQLLDEAEQALRSGDWTLGRTLLQRVLTFDPQNEDAVALLTVAERGLSGAEPPPTPPAGDTPAPVAGNQPLPSAPAAFAGGRYTVKHFLGEGGKKRVYLAHDSTLDRDVASP